MYRNITVERAGPVGTLTLNRPEKMNAWSYAMVAEVTRALAELGRQPDLRALIVTGSGDKAFSAGGDLAETAAVADGEAGARWAETWNAFLDAFRRVETPMVAAVNGVAAGSGFQVALLADVRVAHEGVRMGLPEINGGVASVLGPWAMLSRLGLSRTVELTLTGRLMDAQECWRAGIVHHLVPRENLMAKAHEVAGELAAKPPLAMRLNKRRFRAMTQAAFDETRAANVAQQRESFASGEPQARAAAFLAERGRRKG